MLYGVQWVLAWQQQHQRSIPNVLHGRSSLGGRSHRLTATTTTQLFVEPRRQFLQRMTVAVATVVGTTTVAPRDAHAGGLLQFPIPPSCPLKNIYHFLRAGPSELEIQGIYSTNALFLTNRDNAMHSATGEALLDDALRLLQQQPPTIAFHSLAANAMDTGDYIARKLQMGREKLLPEFTYLDPRGAGVWNDSEESLVKPAIWALDVLEGGERGMNGRPPPTIDGTPNETLNDQFVRLRQFLSLQESRTSGDVILVIFPDGTGPALLSCMIAGIPYKDCHALEFQPGEVRLNITPDSVRQLYDQRKDDPTYLETIERGKVELKRLLLEQGEDSATTVVSLKERREDKVQADIEQAYQERRRNDAAFEIQKRNEQVERQKQMEIEYAERNRIKKQRQDQERRETKVRAAAVPAPSRVTGKATNDASLPSSSLTTTPKNDPSSPTSLPAMVGLGAVGLGALGLLAMASGGGSAAAGGSSDNKELVTSPAATSSTPTLPVHVAEEGEGEEAPVRMDIIKGQDPGRESVDPEENLSSTSTTRTSSSFQAPTVQDGRTLEEYERDLQEPHPLSSQSVEESLHQLAMAEQAMMDALVEAGQTTQQGSSLLLDSPVPAITRTSTTAASLPTDDDQYNGDDDYGDDDWLRVLVEIRDEDDQEEVLLINGNSNEYFNEL
jgi:hypothetical protein